ncbi:MAG: hypothetical protein PHE84_00165 [bacterium]|nr:hypothetical protein [bacterium]
MRHAILVITFILVIGVVATATGYHWAFGQGKVQFAAALEHGDGEILAPEAGLLPPAAPTKVQPAADSAGLLLQAKPLPPPASSQTRPVKPSKASTAVPQAKSSTAADATGLLPQTGGEILTPEAGLLPPAAPIEARPAADAPGILPQAKPLPPLNFFIVEPKAKDLKTERTKISPKVAFSPEIMAFPEGGGHLGVRADF